MFWDYNNIYSSLEELMSRTEPVPTLEEFLDEPEFIQELKTGNNKLIHLINRPQFITAIVKWCVSCEHDKPVKEQCKYAYICQQVICSDILPIRETLIHNLGYLDPIFGFFVNSGDERTFNNSLIVANCVNVLSYFVKSYPNLLKSRFVVILPHMYRFLFSSSVQDFVLLLQSPLVDAARLDYIKVLLESRFVDVLYEKFFSVDGLTSVQYHAIASLFISLINYQYYDVSVQKGNLASDYIFAASNSAAVSKNSYSDYSDFSVFISNNNKYANGNAKIHNMSLVNELRSSVRINRLIQGLDNLTFVESDFYKIKYTLIVLNALFDLREGCNNYGEEKLLPSKVLSSLGPYLDLHFFLPNRIDLKKLVGHLNNFITCDFLGQLDRRQGVVIIYQSLRLLSALFFYSPVCEELTNMLKSFKILEKMWTLLVEYHRENMIHTVTVNMTLFMLLEGSESFFESMRDAKNSLKSHILDEMRLLDILAVILFNCLDKAKKFHYTGYIINFCSTLKRIVDLNSSFESLLNSDEILVSPQLKFIHQKMAQEELNPEQLKEMREKLKKFIFTDINTIERNNRMDLKIKELYKNFMSPVGFNVEVKDKNFDLPDLTCSAVFMSQGNDNQKDNNNNDASESINERNLGFNFAENSADYCNKALMESKLDEAVLHIEALKNNLSCVHEKSKKSSTLKSLKSLKNCEFSLTDNKDNLNNNHNINTIFNVHEKWQETKSEILQSLVNTYDVTKQENLYNDIVNVEHTEIDTILPLNERLQNFCIENPQVTAAADVNKDNSSTAISNETLVNVLESIELQYRRSNASNNNLYEVAGVGVRSRGLERGDDDPSWLLLDQEQEHNFSSNSQNEAADNNPFSEDD